MYGEHQDQAGPQVAGSHRGEGIRPATPSNGRPNYETERAMAAEIEALRAEVARLQAELAATRQIAQAGEAMQLGRTLLVYVLDVICALLTPQRAQTIMAGAADSQEAKDAQAGIGPLQMALERPGLSQALEGRASRLTTRYESVLWLPIMHGAVVAVVLCLRRPPSNPFSAQEQEMGAVLGPLLISALQTSHQLFDLQDNQEALRTLSSTMSARVRLGGARLTEMGRDAERLAHCFDIDAAGRAAIRLGAILHDIGTVDLADGLLQKEDTLSRDEVMQMRLHTVFGAEIVRQIPDLEPVIPLVLYHHECWDGTGYPSGLAAGDIPLGARIIAVVDAFHAMTSPRPYRPPLSIEAAVQELHRCAGTQFDSRVVDEFVRLVRENS